MNEGEDKPENRAAEQLFFMEPCTIMAYFSCSWVLCNKRVRPSLVLVTSFFFLLDSESSLALALEKYLSIDFASICDKHWPCATSCPSTENIPFNGRH